MAEVIVEGISQLDRAFAKSSKDLQRGLREEFRVAAEPVRQQTEQLAIARIRNIGGLRPRSWANMRTGQVRGLVYIAPKQRGRLTRQNPQRYRRHKFKPILKRQMEDALAANEEQVVKRLEFMLSVIKARNGF